MLSSYQPLFILQWVFNMWSVFANSLCKTYNHQNERCIILHLDCYKIRMQIRVYLYAVPSLSTIVCIALV